jgi:hypothetical protein
MPRVRHGVECPKCRTRYLPASSPYPNGSYLLPLTKSSSAGWTLYCSCGRPQACTHWGWNELKPYAVSRQAHRRGYGSPDEIWDASLPSQFRDMPQGESAETPNGPFVMPPLMARSPDPPGQADKLLPPMYGLHGGKRFRDSQRREDRPVRGGSTW